MILFHSYQLINIDLETLFWHPRFPPTVPPLLEASQPPPWASWPAARCTSQRTFFGMALMGLVDYCNTLICAAYQFYQIDDFYVFVMNKQLQLIEL